MQYRTVPKNGDKLSILGFGAMRLPMKRRQIDESRAQAQIYSAIDQGVNYVDTAWPYHNGASETFLGKILPQNGYREKIKLATKLPHWSAKSKTDMLNILDKQLAKLQTDHIDYYLVHNLNKDNWALAKEHSVLEFLDDALKSGKILNAGFSYHGAARDFNSIVDDYDWTFCQLQYNYLDTENQAGKAGLEYAASKNLGIIVMEPLRGGNLSKTPPKAVQKIWDESDEKKSPAEWSLRWIWDHPQVTTVLSGMNEEAHIEENIKIASSALPNAMSESDRNRVDTAAATFRQLMKAGCTGCQYCVPCPKNVNIPGCFELYNSLHTFKEKRAKFRYMVLNGGIIGGKPGMASQCIDCGVCLEKCPQNLPIPDLLKDVKNDFEGIMTKPTIWLAKQVVKRMR